MTRARIAGDAGGAGDGAARAGAGAARVLRLAAAGPAGRVCCGGASVRAEAGGRRGAPILRRRHQRRGAASAPCGARSRCRRRRVSSQALQLGSSGAAPRLTTRSALPAARRMWLLRVALRVTAADDDAVLLSFGAAQQLLRHDASHSCFGGQEQSARCQQRFRSWCLRARRAHVDSAQRTRAGADASRAPTTDAAASLCVVVRGGVK